MRIFAHRGASGHKPENTLAAFQKAVDLKCDGVELDVHCSADGEVVVIHDETVDRTTSRSGNIADFSAASLREIDVPSLAEVLQLLDAKCVVNIELKGEGTALKVIQLIEKAVNDQGWKYNQFIVSSFNWNDLKLVRDTNPQIPIGVLTATDLELAVAFSKFIKAETVHPYFHLLNFENVAEMQRDGLSVFAWTVNEPEDIARLKTYNVNGLITDFPDRT